MSVCQRNINEVNRGEVKVLNIQLATCLQQATTVSAPTKIKACLTTIKADSDKYIPTWRRRDITACSMDIYFHRILTLAYITIL